MDEQLKENLKSGNAWKRLLYMLLFVVIWGVAEVVLTLTVLFQFGHVLITGGAQARALRFGQSLSTFFYQILLFLTFNSERQPWPFAPWPKGVPPRSQETGKQEGQETNVDGY